MPENISAHITYREATQSQAAVRRGLDNFPDAQELASMRALAEAIYEPIVAHFGLEPYVSSFFRSPRLNAAIGGALGSQHCLGEAIDIDADVYGGVSNRELFEYVRTQLPFDQVIWEFGTFDNPDWVHVSYKVGANRGKATRAVRVNGKTQYLRWVA